MAKSVQQYSDAEIAAAAMRIEMLSRLMDDMFTLPGTNMRIGLDAIIGIVPVLGDLISQAVSSYLIWEARRIGVSRLTIARMIGNSAIDTVVGFIPFVGDAFDIAFKANMKNLNLLKAHLEKRGFRPSADGLVIDGTARRID